MKLIVTIDTEEDNWLPFSKSGYTTENIRQVPGLQRLFADVGIRPTYLTTYQVATNPESAAILREVAEQRTGEIGAHCHPWNQPPFEETASMKNSMLCNLPGELQIRKIETLHDTIQERIGVTPTAFRSGRWGYSAAVARALVKLNDAERRAPRQTSGGASRREIFLGSTAVATHSPRSPRSGGRRTQSRISLRRRAACTRTSGIVTFSQGSAQSRFANSHPK